MTKITFYGVVGEIGGNKILIEDRTKKGMLENFIEKSTERTQIMATIIFASFAFFAVRFYITQTSQRFFNLSGEIVHRKENQPQRAQSFDIFLCVLCALCGFQIKK